MTQEYKPSSAISDLSPAVANPSQWLQDVMSVPRDEGFVEVAGCSMKYYRWGDPSKPGIIMQHGFLAHSRCFAFIAPYLAQDYHVVAYDHSGMGDSGWRDEYSESIRANELKEVCEQLSLFDDGRKPTIIAHSFGGRIGTAGVHAYPDCFAGLIICDLMIIRPSILKANAELFAPPTTRREPGQANRIYPDYETAKQRFVLSPKQKVEHEELFDFMAYHSLRKVEGGWQWKFDPQVLIRMQTLEQSWVTIGELVTTAPCRKAIVYGQKSFLFNDDSVNYMNEIAEQKNCEKIPMIGIPHARHHLMLDQPIAFASALKSILALWSN